MGEACVVAADAVAGVRAEGDTALVATTIGEEQGCPDLEQRRLRFVPGRSQPRREERDDVLYVVSGSGRSTSTESATSSSRAPASTSSRESRTRSTTPGRTSSWSSPS